MPHALIIDDSKPVRSILAQILERLAFDVVEAANGKEALECVRQQDRFDIVWVNWNMPVMDGLEFVKAVRSDAHCDEVRLVMVTAEWDSAHIQWALKAGADDYMAKPFSQKVVEEKLTKFGMHPRKPAPAMTTSMAARSAPAPTRKSPPPLKEKKSPPAVAKATTGKTTTGMTSAIRVMIVDDSVVVRGVVKKIVASDPELQVADVAADGRIALNKLATANPDIVLLDIEMPNMDGFQTLEELRRVQPRLPVIMFSSLTERGASSTVKALTLGAVDYVHKPGGSQMKDHGSARIAIEEELIPKIKRHARRTKPTVSAGQSNAGVVDEATSPATRDSLPRPLPIATRKVPRAAAQASAKIEIVAIATSTGGPNALATLLPTFAPTCPVPIVIVQHMPPVFTQHLASRLTEVVSIPVCEAEQGVPLKPLHVTIAPGGYHMTVGMYRGRCVCGVNQEPPENACRPSADVLFRSVTEVYRAGTLAVVLTGMGQDGLRGCERVVECGGQVLAQDKETSVVWGMPGHVARAGLADAVLPLDRIGAEIKRRIQRRRRE